MKRATVVTLLGLALIVVMLAAKQWLLQPPALPGRVAAGAFDANRAHARLDRLLAERVPHPIDSAANDRVRARIVAELRAAGLAPRVSDDIVCGGGSDNRTVACGRVRNIVATAGPAQGKALLLVAHYDSTPVGPGAADDGVGVAVMLEIAHLLKDRTLTRPIIFLIDDGEEAGLLGARAFLDRDPAAKRVARLINMESRGVSGPALMFETSRPNAAPLSAFEVVDRPAANSLSTDLYHLIPNSTDVAVFDEAPWSILNFAIIANETRYHAPGDVPAALDRRSLNHMGGQALALTNDWLAGTRHAGSGTKVYADLATHALVVLPLAVAIVSLAVLLLIAGLIAWRRGAMWRGIAVPASAVLGAAAAGWIGNLFAAAVLTGEYWRGVPQLAALAVDIGAVGVATLMLAWIGRRRDDGQARIGAWLFVLVFGAVVSAVAPGGSIFFLFAPAIALAGMAAGQRWPIVERTAGWIAALLLLVTFAEFIGGLELLLVSGPVWGTAPLTVVAVLPLLVELRAMSRQPSLRALAPIAALAWLSSWGAVLAAPRATSDRKARFVIEHVTDANRRTAQWGIATDGARLPRSYAKFGDWRTALLPYSNRSRWVAPAPALPVPVVDMLDPHAANNAKLRRIAFRLRTNGATSVIIRLPADASVIEAGLAGAMRRVAPRKSDDRYTLRCAGRSCDGAVVHLALERTAPVTITLIAMQPGLPNAARPLIAARPALAAPQYTPDARYVIRRIRL